MSNPQQDSGQERKLLPLALVGCLLAFGAIGVIFVPGVGRASPFAALAALVTSIVAVRRIDRSGGALGGKVLAVSGLIIAATWLILTSFFVGRSVLS